MRHFVTGALYFGALFLGFGLGWSAHRAAMRQGETLTAADLEPHIRVSTKQPPFRMVPIPAWVPSGARIGEVRGIDGTIWFSELDGGSAK